jgi:AcrR family transcriptional regulator
MVSADAARLARADRRDALLDVAAEMVAEGRTDGVSMEAVAGRAAVSRSLVYKHFANRRDLLGALYERESARLHAELASEVGAATSLADMFRALVRGALRAQAQRGATFAALATGGVRGSTQRSVQRRRDAQTLRYFVRRAQSEYGLTEETARAGLAMALGTMPTVLAQWRARPTQEHAAQLEDAYVSMAVGGLKELAAAGPENAGRQSVGSTQGDPFNRVAVHPEHVSEILGSGHALPGPPRPATRDGLPEAQG